MFVASVIKTFHRSICVWGSTAFTRQSHYNYLSLLFVRSFGQSNTFHFISLQLHVKTIHKTWERTASVFVIGYLCYFLVTHTCDRSIHIVANRSGAVFKLEFFELEHIFGNDLLCYKNSLDCKLADVFWLVRVVVFRIHLNRKSCVFFVFAFITMVLQNTTTMVITW